MSNVITAPAMPQNLTPAQMAQQEKRNRRGQESLGEKPAGDGLPPAPAPAPLRLMLGEGIALNIEGRKVEIARFFLKDHGRFQELISSVEMAHLIALASSHDPDTGEYDMARMAENLNAMIAVASQRSEDVAARVEDLEAFTPEYCAYYVSNLSLEGVSSDLLSRMTDLVLLAASRKTPDLTREDVSNFLDLSNFLDVARAVMRVNSGMRDRLFV
jgi:hypothetical protein